MPAPKINLILLVLLNGAVFFLFVALLQTKNAATFASKRIDELEKRPLVSQQSETAPDSNLVVNQLVPAPTTPGKTAAPSSSPTTTQTPTTRPSATPTTQPSSPRITYLPLFGGGAQTTDNSWVDVVGSDFQLRIGDYGFGANPSWEAIAWVIGGSGNVKLRLFDTTNSVAVTGSEISGSSSKPMLLSSGRLNFFSGNNTYRVQISSQTSSTVQFDFGRVKVVY